MASARAGSSQVGATAAGHAIVLARTGYTGEDGFELYVPNAQAEALWTSLQNAGGEDVVPCGLACRDTLRLEAGMPLYGHELDRTTSPYDAGLGNIVALGKAGNPDTMDGVHPELVSDPLDRPTSRAGILARVHRHPRRSLLKLNAVLPRC